LRIEDVSRRAAFLRPDQQFERGSSDGRKRRRWGEVRVAIETVLGSAGELHARDIHAAVEAVLGEDVSPSSVKNCLATSSTSADPSFVRVERGRYRLA
jgi:hypothetical protein